MLATAEPVGHNSALERPRAGPWECLCGRSRGFRQREGLGSIQGLSIKTITLNACDFGDLLLHNLKLFTEHNAILADYQRRFKYMMVDEYQDTNVAQYLWLRLLAMEHRNICCVGDDDQSIYSWRGAEIGNILKFEKDFDGAQIIRLEQNYRSTPEILAAASALIACNAGRLGKTLWTEAEKGEKVSVEVYGMEKQRHERYAMK